MNQGRVLEALRLCEQLLDYGDAAPGVGEVRRLLILALFSLDLPDPPLDQAGRMFLDLPDDPPAA